MASLGNKAATLVATSLAFAVIQLDVTVVNVAVKQIGAAFGGGTSQMQWVIDSYTLMLAALILTAGSLGDRFGARRLLSAGFVVFVAASMACGLAPSMTVLIVARSVQGAGAALLGSCSLALLSHTFSDPRSRARAVARLAAGASVALSAGPVVGGLLIAAVGWRGIFFINAPIGLAGLWLTLRYAPRTPGSADRRADPRGAFLATATLALFAAALIEAGPDGFASPLVLVGLALSLLAAAAFIWTEARAATPMLPAGLFRRRQFALPVSIGFLVNVCFYGLIFLFSLLFQAHQRMSALEAGLAFVPMTAAIIAGNLVSGRVAAAVGPARTIFTGLAAIGAGCAGLLWTGQSTGYLAVLAQQVLLGGGLGLLVPPMTSLLLSSADRSRSGVASGALTAFRQAGSLLGVALFGTLAAGDGRFYAGLHVALWISIAILAMSCALSVRLHSRSLTRAPADFLQAGRSPPQFGYLVEPCQLVRVRDRVDRGDPAVLDSQAHRGGLAIGSEPGARHPVEPHACRREVVELPHEGQQRHHLPDSDDWLGYGLHHTTAVGDQHHVGGEHLHQRVQVPG
jgi:MFS transporter, DHA2 family, methylenomycin A resistance protein